MARIRSKEHARRKRKRLLWRIFGSFGGLLLVVAGLIGLTHWGQIQIQSFQIKSGPAVATTTVQDVVNKALEKSWLSLVSQDNILLLPRAAIKENIREISIRIRSADINITGFRQFRVSVQAREPSARLCASDGTSTSGCRLVDATGLAYATTTRQASTSVITISTEGVPDIGDRVVPHSVFGQFISFLRQLPELSFVPMSAKLQDYNDVVIRTHKQGINTLTATSTVDIKINLQDDLQRKFSGLKTAVDRSAFVASSTSTGEENPPSISPFQLEYIDLRFGNKIFYK